VNILELPTKKLQSAHTSNFENYDLEEGENNPLKLEEFEKTLDFKKQRFFRFDTQDEELEEQDVNKNLPSIREDEEQDGKSDEDDSDRKSDKANGNRSLLIPKKEDNTESSARPKRHTLVASSSKKSTIILDAQKRFSVSGTSENHSDDNSLKRHDKRKNSSKGSSKERFDEEGAPLTKRSTVKEEPKEDDEQENENGNKVGGETAEQMLASGLTLKSKKFDDNDEAISDESSDTESDDVTTQ